MFDPEHQPEHQGEATSLASAPYALRHGKAFGIGGGDGVVRGDGDFFEQGCNLTHVLG